MGTLIKYIFTWFVKPILTIYLKKDRHFRYKNLHLIIFKGIFHPQFFFSSKYLASFVEKLNLQGKQFCEPCTGSGLISLIALQKGANVTCFDINPKSIENVKANFERNKNHLISHQFNPLESNLFESIPKTIFDFIVVNPPYFFKDHTSPENAAWYAGNEGQFFSTFFSQLKNYTNNFSEIYMILASNCEIERITQMANNHKWELALIEQKKILWETNYIFRIQNA